MSIFVSSMHTSNLADGVLHLFLSLCQWWHGLQFFHESDQLGILSTLVSPSTTRSADVLGGVVATAEVHKPPCVGNVSTSDASSGLANTYVTRIKFLSC